MIDVTPPELDIVTVLLALEIEMPEPAAIVIAGPVIELIEVNVPDAPVDHWTPVPVLTNTWPLVPVPPPAVRLPVNVRLTKYPLRLASIASTLLILIGTPLKLA